MGVKLVRVVHNLTDRLHTVTGSVELVTWQRIAFGLSVILSAGTQIHLCTDILSTLFCGKGSVVFCMCVTRVSPATLEHH